MDALEQVRNLEAQLDEVKKEVIGTLKESRASLGLSLRDAGKKVRLTATQLSNIERGKSWKTQSMTKTIQRIVRAYDKLAA